MLDVKMSKGTCLSKVCDRADLVLIVHKLAIVFGNMLGQIMGV